MRQRALVATALIDGHHEATILSEYEPAEPAHPAGVETRVLGVEQDDGPRPERLPGRQRRGHGLVEPPCDQRSARRVRRPDAGQRDLAESLGGGAAGLVGAPLVDVDHRGRVPGKMLLQPGPHGGRDAIEARGRAHCRHANDEVSRADALELGLGVPGQQVMRHGKGLLSSREVGEERQVVAEMPRDEEIATHVLAAGGAHPADHLRIAQ